jgi:hypothetical protein
MSSSLLYWGSTQPRHPNTKIPLFSLLVPNPVRLETNNTTQDFLKSHFTELVTFSYPSALCFQLSTSLAFAPAATFCLDYEEGIYCPNSYLSCSQISLDPSVDCCPCGYTTKVKKQESGRKFTLITRFIVRRLPTTTTS